MEITKKKKTSKKKSKKPTEEKKTQELPDKAPLKSENHKAWFDWYRQTIIKMLNDGKSLTEICEKLNIREDTANNFIK